MKLQPCMSYTAYEDILMSVDLRHLRAASRVPLLPQHSSTPAPYKGRRANHSCLQTHCSSASTSRLHAATFSLHCLRSKQYGTRQCLRNPLIFTKMPFAVTADQSHKHIPPTHPFTDARTLRPHPALRTRPSPRPQQRIRMDVKETEGQHSKEWRNGLSCYVAPILENNCEMCSTSYLGCLNDTRSPLIGKKPGIFNKAYAKLQLRSFHSEQHPTELQESTTGDCKCMSPSHQQLSRPCCPPHSTDQLSRALPSTDPAEPAVAPPRHGASSSQGRSWTSRTWKPRSFTDIDAAGRMNPSASSLIANTKHTFTGEQCRGCFPDNEMQISPQIKAMRNGPELMSVHPRSLSKLLLAFRCHSSGWLQQLEKQPWTLLGVTEKHEATTRAHSAAKGATGPKAFAASLYTQDKFLPASRTPRPSPRQAPSSEVAAGSTRQGHGSSEFPSMHQKHLALSLTPFWPTAAGAAPDNAQTQFGGRHIPQAAHSRQFGYGQLAEVDSSAKNRQQGTVRCHLYQLPAASTLTFSVSVILQFPAPSVFHRPEHNAVPHSLGAGGLLVTVSCPVSFLTSAVIPGIGGMVGKGLPHLIHEAGEKSVTQDVGNLRVPPGAAPADNMPLSGKVSSPRRQRQAMKMTKICFPAQGRAADPSHAGRIDVNSPPSLHTKISEVIRSETISKSNLCLMHHASPPTLPHCMLSLTITIIKTPAILMFWENFNDALACNSYCNFFVFVPQTRVSPGLEAQLRYQPHWAGERNAESDAALTQPMTTVPQYFQKEAGEKQMLWYFGREYREIDTEAQSSCTVGLKVCYGRKTVMDQITKVTKCLQTAQQPMTNTKEQIPSMCRLLHCSEGGDCLTFSLCSRSGCICGSQIPALRNSERTNMFHRQHSVPRTKADTLPVLLKPSLTAMTQENRLYCTYGLAVVTIDFQEITTTKCQCLHRWQVNVNVFTAENPQNLEVFSTDVFLQVTRTIQLLILDENFYKMPSRTYSWHCVFLLKSAFSGSRTHPSYTRYFLERSLPSRRPASVKEVQYLKCNFQFESLPQLNCSCNSNAIILLGFAFETHFFRQGYGRKRTENMNQLRPNDKKKEKTTGSKRRGSLRASPKDFSIFRNKTCEAGERRAPPPETPSPRERGRNSPQYVVEQKQMASPFISPAVLDWCQRQGDPCTARGAGSSSCLGCDLGTIPDTEPLAPDARVPSAGAVPPPPAAPGPSCQDSQSIRTHSLSLTAPGIFQGTAYPHGFAGSCLTQLKDPAPHEAQSTASRAHSWQPPWPMPAPPAPCRQPTWTGNPRQGAQEGCRIFLDPPTISGRSALLLEVEKTLGHCWLGGAGLAVSCWSLGALPRAGALRLGQSRGWKMLLLLGTAITNLHG
ncbi:hypothetical protein Anapl_10585 [Anas platyrhynchos]|uniref:Uncharacterized protein n=1 Tax=Anas platyrhynchos TaxID=8839 RepID=R0M4J9_ANAPL|nr:hypothetical protein Anapl_10585 [Anas platyrhynchos]